MAIGRVALLAALAVCVTFAGSAEEAAFSLEVAPAVGIPLAGDAGYFSVGGAADVRATFSLPFLPILKTGAAFGYKLAPLGLAERAIGDSLSLLAGGAVLGLEVEILPKLRVSARAGGGYFYSFFTDQPTSSGTNPYVEGGMGVSYRLRPGFGLGLGVSYRNYLGLYNDLQIALAASLHVPRRPRPGVERPAGDTPPLEPLHEQAGGVQIVSVRFDNIFPVFFKYYDSHPIGTATIRNAGGKAVERVQLTFNVKQYMDNPKAAPLVERLDPGEQTEVDIYGLFTSAVLDISEGTVVSALLSVGYVRDGEEQRQEFVETIRLQNRNAVTWDDDRKAAAFVTAKDAVVLKFARNVAGIIADREQRGVDSSLLAAVGLHETLDLYGITYVPDPTTPYLQYSKQAEAIDYLQFPKQTLEFTAGDCDDLSILYAALLEALGVETAFVTTPGHIFVAFALKQDPEEARRQFRYPDELIYREGKAWIPVEITDRGRGFLKAWESGAKQWRENSAKDQCGLFPMRASWGLYEPVGFPGTPPIELPARGEITAAFDGEVARIVQREISARVTELEREIARDQNDARTVNKLGVLYATYGLDELALGQFDRILEDREYVPALINAGNIHFLRGDFERAGSCYARAEAAAPDDARVLLCVARVAHEVENYGTARRAYDRLKEIDPKTAERFGYLALRGEEASRAADVVALKGVVVWDEE